MKAMKLILCFMLSLNVNCILWDRYHRQIDDELPAISWKDCGRSALKYDPSILPEISPNTRIDGGEYAVNGEFPWFAFIEMSIGVTDRTWTSKCGGSILNEWWVLTAAHCCTQFLNNITVLGGRVLLGSVDYPPPKGVGVWRSVERFVVNKLYFEDRKLDAQEKDSMIELKLELGHWEISGRIIDKEFKDKELDFKKKFYDYSKKDDTGYWYRNDMALLKLKDRIIPVFNESHFIVNSICLPKPGIVNDLEEDIVYIGFGATAAKTETVSNRMKKGVSLLLNSSTCAKRYKLPWLCTELTNRSSLPLYNSTSCHGDSGGPYHQYLGWQAVQLGLQNLIDPLNGRCGHHALMGRVSLLMDWIRSYVSGTDIEVESETNHLLLVFVILTSIIALVVGSALIWIFLLLLRPRIQNSMLRFIYCN